MIGWLGQIHHVLVRESPDSPNDFQNIRDAVSSKPVRFGMPNPGGRNVYITLLSDEVFQKTQYAQYIIKKYRSFTVKTDYLHIIVVDREVVVADREVRRPSVPSAPGGGGIAQPAMPGGGGVAEPSSALAGEEDGGGRLEPYKYGDGPRRERMPTDQQWGAAKRRASGEGGRVFDPAVVKMEIDGAPRPSSGLPDDGRFPSLYARGRPPTPPPCPREEDEEEEEEEVTDKLLDQMAKVLDFMKNNNKDLVQVQMAVRNTLKNKGEQNGKGPGLFVIEGNKGYKTFMKKYREFEKERAARGRLVTSKVFKPVLAPDAPRGRGIRRDVGGGGRGPPGGGGIGRGRGRGRGRGHAPPAPGGVPPSGLGGLNSDASTSINRRRSRSRSASPDTRKRPRQDGDGGGPGDHP